MNGSGVWSILITKSSGISCASTLIARWKEKPISLKKRGETGCFAVVARRFINLKIDWHHEKFKDMLPPFSFSRERSFAKMIPYHTAGFLHIFDQLYHLVQREEEVCSREISLVALSVPIGFFIGFNNPANRRFGNTKLYSCRSYTIYYAPFGNLWTLLLIIITVLLFFFFGGDSPIICCFWTSLSSISFRPLA